MPTLPKAYCWKPYCPNKEPCPRHGTVKRIYHTKRWRLTRKRVLALAHYRCSHPKCLRWATDVDHITPLRMGGAVYNLSNLQALCHQHHSTKTRLEQ